MYSYNYLAAKDYALARCSSYNSSYCNYNPCGGDCANFVSQCFRAGNQIDGGAWYTIPNGACGRCGTQASYAGTDTWANNDLLRQWVIDSSQGQALSDKWGLGIGDIINYDKWDPDPNKVIDHVTVMGLAGVIGCRKRRLR